MIEYKNTIMLNQGSIIGMTSARAANVLGWEPKCSCRMSAKVRQCAEGLILSSDGVRRHAEVLPESLEGVRRCCEAVSKTVGNVSAVRRIAPADGGYSQAVRRDTGNVFL